VRQDLRDSAGGARGQRLQHAISADAEPFDDRGRQDALAVAGGEDLISASSKLDGQR
jgi:hypothetical protein